MRRSLIPLALWLTVSPSVVQGAGPPVTMTMGAIEEAIALGRQTAPRPYVLRLSRADDVYHSASVYTPFIRVALASHMAMLEGRTLAPSQIDRALVEPLLYVAVPSRQGNELSRVTATSATLYLVAPGSRERITPLWTRPAGSVLQWLERDAEIKKVALVAAFSLDAVRPGRSLALLVRAPRYVTRTTAFIYLGPFTGQITQSELDKWR